jgi:hypothetical protein
VSYLSTGNVSFSADAGAVTTIERIVSRLA